MYNDPFFNSSGFDTIFIVFMSIIIIGMCFIFGIMIFQMSQYMKDKSKPIQTERAKVIAKRTNVRRHHHNNHHSTSSSYYVTFEFLSGQRMELKVPSNQFGYLIEGDEGLLQFQGQLFNSFERVPKL